MTYLCTGRLADGTTRAPHDYGVAILLLAAFRGSCPPIRRPASMRALVGFLDGSSLVDADPAGADGAVREPPGRRATQFAEPARTFWRWSRSGTSAQLGPRLLPLVEALGGDPALSPERSPATAAPVFAVHGLDDNVIPAFETTRLIAWLQQSRPRPRVRAAHATGVARRCSIRRRSSRTVGPSSASGPRRGRRWPTDEHPPAILRRTAVTVPIRLVSAPRHMPCTLRPRSTHVEGA